MTLPHQIGPVIPPGPRTPMLIGPVIPPGSRGPAGPPGPVGPAGPIPSRLARMTSRLFVTWSDIFWNWIPGTVVDVPLSNLSKLFDDPGPDPYETFESALIWLETNVGMRNILYSFDLVFAPCSNELELRVKFLRRKDAMMWWLVVG